MTDDFVLNVKQIAQYDLVTATLPSDRFLLQRNGVGGPYQSIAPNNLLTTALENGGWLKLAPNNGIAWNGAALGFNAESQAFEFTEPVEVPSLRSVGDIFVDGEAVATQAFVTDLTDNLFENSVWDFNGRRGHVQLEADDILRAGGVLQWNPTFGGVVTVPTLWNPEQKDDSAASTAFVQNAICHWLLNSPLVQSFNGRTGPVTLTTADVNAAFFTVDAAVPQAPNPPPYDASNRIATTFWVDDAVQAAAQTIIIQMDDNTQAVLDYLNLNYAPLASPQLTGIPQAPTAGVGTATGQIATTAFVMQAVAESVAGVVSFNTRTGNVVFTAQDLSDVGGAFLNSPIFTGTPSGPTATAGTNSTQLATTAFVQQALSAAPGGVSSFNTRTGAITLTLADVTAVGGAPINNTALTGAPTAPTPTLGDNSTRIATTAWVLAEVSAIAAGVATFNGRSGVVTLTSADISGAGGALLASPQFTGIPQAPTAVAGTNTQQLATTAFVTAAVGALQGVTSFNNRTGAVTLSLADITAAGGAPTASPVLTGAPAAPTASPGTATVQIATTAFVMNAISGFYSSPALTGIPTAPTAGLGTANTQIATTAFVAAALAAMPQGGVTSFNARSGAVALTWADVSAVGGAPLASPALTGVPTAPTAPPATNTTQVATTAFVTAALGGGGVVASFNSRQGAVTLTAADIVGASGALFQQGDTAPANTANKFWFDSVGGQLYVNYVDPVTSAQNWVIANTPQPAQPASGARVLLQTQTVTTPVAYVNFPNVFDATFDDYELVISQWGLAGATNDTPAFQITTDGTTWLTTAAYAWSINGAAQTAAAYGLCSNQIGGPLASGAMGLHMQIWGPSFSGSYKAITAQGGVWYTGGALSSTSMTYIGVTGPYVGIRFFFAGGNQIARGTFKLYGIVK